MVFEINMTTISKQGYGTPKTRLLRFGLSNINDKQWKNSVDENSIERNTELESSLYISTDKIPTNQKSPRKNNKAVLLMNRRIISTKELGIKMAAESSGYNCKNRWRNLSVKLYHSTVQLVEKGTTVLSKQRDAYALGNVKLQLNSLPWNENSKQAKQDSKLHDLQLPLDSWQGLKKIPFSTPECTEIKNFIVHGNGRKGYIGKIWKYGTACSFAERPRTKTTGPSDMS